MRDRGGQTGANGPIVAPSRFLVALCHAQLSIRTSSFIFQWVENAKDMDHAYTTEYTSHFV